MENKINFQEYSDKAYSLAQYGDSLFIGENGNFKMNSISALYPFLALGGEVGEIQEKIKKVIRDKNGEINSETRSAILKELGDVLWYINACARDLHSSLEGVARMNLDKLFSRQERGTLKGSGDDR